MTTDRPVPAGATSGAAPVDPRALASGSPRRRSPRHPLLGLFPLAVMTLATFLVVFALLMARLQGGADPALRSFANGVTLARSASGAGGVVTTRASGGGGGGGGTDATGASTGAEGPSPLVTRSSGRGGGERDDA